MSSFSPPLSSSASTLRVRLSPAQVVIVSFAVADDGHGDPHTAHRAPTFGEVRLAIARLSGWAAQMED